MEAKEKDELIHYVPPVGRSPAISRKARPQYILCACAREAKMITAPLSLPFPQLSLLSTRSWECRKCSCGQCQPDVLYTLPASCPPPGVGKKALTPCNHCSAVAKTPCAINTIPATKAKQRAICTAMRKINSTEARQW